MEAGKKFTTHCGWRQPAPRRRSRTSVYELGPSTAKSYFQAKMSTRPRMFHYQESTTKTTNVFRALLKLPSLSPSRSKSSPPPALASTSTSAKSNLQLAVYSMYLEQLDDNEIGGLPLSSSLYFLRDEEKPIREHSFTTDEISKTKEKIIDVAAGIRNRKFEATKGKHCDWCDYKSLLCPVWEQ